MSYKFKYIPNQIYKDGFLVGNLEEFLAENPNFPIVEGSYFEYREDGSIDIINNDGHHLTANKKDHKILIDAINKLY